MKKLLMIALLMVSILGFSQKEKKNREDYNPEQKAEMMSLKMKKSLNLTDEQTKEVKTLLLTKVEKNQEIKKEFKEKNQEAIKKLKEERNVTKNRMLEEKAITDSELKKILTEVQYAKYMENQKVRAEKMAVKKEERIDKLEERKKLRALKKSSKETETEK